MPKPRLISLAMFLGFFAGAPAGVCLPLDDLFGTGLDPTAEKYLLEQAQKPFEEKFSTLTKDPAATSSANLKRLEAEFDKARPLDPEQKNLAAEMARETSGRVRAQHATTFANALKIMEAGAVLSPDELVRRGTLPASTKVGARSLPCTDGEIGEQDVVFVALQDPAAPENISFGDVTFVFDREALLKEGYFTPFAYTVGAPPDLPVSQACGEAKKDDEKIRALYRAYLFRGPAALSSLLSLSARQTILAQENGHPAAPRNDGPTIATGLFELFNETPGAQNLLNCFSPVSAQQSPAGDSVSPSFRILSAYKNFPESTENEAVRRTQAFSFWELKVPRQISLTHLQQVTFTNDPNQWPAIQTLHRTLKEEAKRQGRTFRVERSKFETTYVFGPAPAKAP